MARWQGEHHLLADRCQAEDPGLAKVPFNVVFAGVSHPAMGLDRLVGCLESGIAAAKATGLAVVRQPEGVVRVLRDDRDRSEDPLGEQHVARPGVVQQHRCHEVSVAFAVHSGGFLFLSHYQAFTT